MENNKEVKMIYANNRYYISANDTVLSIVDTFLDACIEYGNKIRESKAAANV